jgi:hypothetical protein
MSEREAREKSVAYEVATISFGTIARAIEVDERASRDRRRERRGVVR